MKSPPVPRWVALGKAPDTLGFTLIELLVVIAIIAILAAILMPALATAKAKGQRITCVNNEKQLTAAMHMYGDDFRDYIAWANWDGSDPANGTQPGWLYTITGGTCPDVGPGGKFENDLNTAYKTGLWFPYMPNPKAYLCPVDIQSKTWTTPRSQGVLNVTVRKNKMSSYVMDGSACYFTADYNGQVDRCCKFSDIWSPM